MLFLFHKNVPKRETLSIFLRRYVRKAPQTSACSFTKLNYSRAQMQTISYTKFLTYYQEYHQKIYRYLYFRTYEDRELAEDLTSDTFLKAFEKLESYNPEYSFSAWIYTIARNSLIDHVRKNSSIQNYDIEDYENYLGTEEDFSSKLDREKDQGQILLHIKKLPPTHQEIVLLKYFNDYTNEEIQNTLDLNPNTLRVNLHRALKKLKELIPAAMLSYFLLISIL